MITTTSGGAPLLTPEQIDDLLVRPVFDQAVALQSSVSTTVRTASTKFRIPIVAADPSAAWVAEGAEIPITDPTLAEQIVTPSKIAGLTVVSNEAAGDTTPAAVRVITDGIARDISRKIDAAFWGTAASPAPAGLPSVVGVGEVDAGSSWLNLDPFAEAISAAEQQFATLTAFVANPADALALAKIKTGSDRNVPLLSPDPTGGTTRRVAGVPILVSPSVEAGTIWGLDASRVRVVIRQDVDLTDSDQPLFTSDRTVVRGVMRVGWAFPHPASIQKISLTP